MHETRWLDDEQRTIYIEFAGNWDALEFIETERQLYKLLSKVGHQVAVILNLTEARPLTMDLVRQLRDLLSTDHPNRGEVVLVTLPDYQPAFGEVVRRALGGKLPGYIHLVDELEQVESWLA